MIKRLMMTSLAVMAMCGVSAAADPVPPVYHEGLPGVVNQNWSGPYVVGTVGGDMGRGAHEHQADSTFGAAGGDYDHEGSEASAGVAAGYNHQIGRVVVGAEVGVRSGVSMDDGGAYEQYNNQTSSEMVYLGTAKARLGVDMGRVMPYVVGGYAGGKVSTRQVYNPAGPAVTTFEDEETAHGYVVGAGVDVQVGERGFVGVEYNYTDLGSTSFSGNDSDGNPVSIDADLSSHSIFGRLGFRF